MEEAEVLVYAGAVTGAELEDVKGGIEMEGEFKVGARGGGVRGEEGDVKRVILLQGGLLDEICED